MLASATLSARLADSSHRLILTLTAPPSEGGLLSALSVSLRDPLAECKALNWISEAEELISSEALGLLYVSPDSAAILAEAFGSSVSL